MCRTPGAYETVKRQCDGLEDCDLFASNGVFGDSCPDANKYLDVNYDCVNNPGKLTWSVIKGFVQSWTRYDAPADDWDFRLEPRLGSNSRPWRITKHEVNITAPLSQCSNSITRFQCNMKSDGTSEIEPYGSSFGLVKLILTSLNLNWIQISLQPPNTSL